MVVVGFNATPSGDVLLAPMKAERLALFWNALGWVLLGPPELIILVGVGFGFGVGVFFLLYRRGRWTGGCGVMLDGVWSGPE
jgi:hypothetical protein